MRQLLAIVIAVLAVSGTAYLVSHKLSNPDHYQPQGGGVCADQVHIVHLTVLGGNPCRPPTRAAWQIPLAILIATLGLGAAVKVAGKRPWHVSRDQYVT